jgi:hypothetical protein
LFKKSFYESDFSNTVKHDVVWVNSPDQNKTSTIWRKWFLSPSFKTCCCCLLVHLLACLCSSLVFFRKPLEFLILSRY